MKNFTFSYIAALLGLMLAGSEARATITYSFVTPQTNYQVAPGATITVPVYLEEELTNGSASLIEANGGLLAGGFSVRSFTQSETTPSTLTDAAGDLSLEGYFGGFYNSTSSSPTLKKVAIASGGSIFPVPDTFDPTDSQVDLLPLGSFTVAAGSPGTASYILANHDYGNALPWGHWNLTHYKGTDTSGTAHYDCDVTSVSPAYIGADSKDPAPVGTGNPTTITFTVTPEPGSLGLLAFAGVSLLSRQRRRLAAVPH